MKWVAKKKEKEKGEVVAEWCVYRYRYRYRKRKGEGEGKERMVEVRRMAVKRTKYQESGSTAAARLRDTTGYWFYANGDHEGGTRNRSRPCHIWCVRVWVVRILNEEGV